MRLPVFSENPRMQRLVLGVLGVAFAIHLVSAVGVFMLRPEAISTTPDPLDYRLAALNILNHGVFSIAPPEFEAPEMLRTPLYPAILAATYALDGESGLGIVLLQSLMLIVAAALLFKILTAFRVSENIALVLMTVYLFEPLQWLYTLHTMTETLTSLLVLVLLAGVFVGKGIHSFPRAALYGIGLGLLVLQKPSAMMWIPFLLLLVLIAQGTWRERVVRVLVAVLVCVLTLVPWMLRNYELSGAFTVSSSSAYNFIYFTGTPDTVPAEYYQTVTDIGYNGHTNVVWYAYTTDAYDMLQETKRDLLARTNYVELVTRQLMCAPTVWFGFLEKNNEESYGHGYGLMASFVAGPNETRDQLILKFDVIAWTLALLLTLAGAVLLLRDRVLRWKVLPLFAMLGATIFINFCASWVRVLLPMYPVILIAVGVALTALTTRIRPPNSPLV